MNEADDFMPPMQPAFQGEKPPTVLGFLMIVWGVILLAAGLYVLSFGPVTPALVGGPAIAISGILLMRDRAGAIGIYFLGVVVMCVWLSATNNVLGAAGSFIFSGLIGLLVAKRRVPILAGILIVFSCLALIGAMMIPGLLLPQKVAWQDFRPSQGLFTVKMPSEPGAPESIVQQRGSYSMTKHLYQSQIAGQGSAMYVVVDFSPALPTERASYQDMLEAEVTNIVNGSSSALVSKQTTTVSGYPAIEFEMRPPENLALKDPKCFVKMFMNSEHLYVLQITATQSSELLAGKEIFFNPEFSYRSSR
jgi:hypothetical protein